MVSKEKIGIVVSNQMMKTAVVLVNTKISHPKYFKTIFRKTKYKAHDPENICQLGDIVKIRETKPLSKTKRWVIVDKITSQSPTSINKTENIKDPIKFNI
uniref:Small ribosomal subunit protein uS17c n=1 Tax=Gloeochaete wittrockiana TaxID=38269 RepID=A0A3G1IW08_9EUKA|nr:ribosomal protein S17 [Gloeochaete wittrockiana]ASQ40221.1 ribosomal protein S17 [Gloeochaete wittrockiana]